jgi:hypothetical protein
VANRRSQIINQLVELLKNNLTGDSPYLTNLYENVSSKLVFWDEVNDYPSVSVYAGPETREYQASDFKWAFLTVNMRIYVEDEDSKDILEQAFEDIENLIDNNNNLVVNGSDLSTDIRLLSISDDEGLFAPLGVGELTFEVRYEV